MQETLTGVWGLFFSAFISATIAPGGSEAVLAYMVSNESYDVQFLVFVAAIGNTLGAMTTWGLGVFNGEKTSSCYPFVREKTECTECSKKERYLGAFFFMVASNRGCLVFCRWMVKASLVASLFSHYVR